MLASGTRLVARLGWILSVVLAVALLLALPAAARERPPTVTYSTATISVIGCSQGMRIWSAYDSVSSQHLAFDDALGGHHLALWAVESPAWAKFDTHVESVTAVFYPLCIKEASYLSNEAAWAGFLQFHALLRQRTQAPLWLSPTNGSQQWCVADNNAQQQYVFDRAVKQGLAARSMIVPVASHPVPDGCHFNPVSSTNVGLAVRDFFESEELLGG